MKRPSIKTAVRLSNLAGNGCFCDTSKAMQVVIELEEKVISKIDAISNDRAEYFRAAIHEKLVKDEKNRLSYEEKLKRTLESYTKSPQLAEEYDVWLDEQVWED